MDKTKLSYLLMSLLVIFLLLPLVSVADEIEQGPDNTDKIKDILLRTMHPNDPPRISEIRALVEREQIPLEEVEDILMGFVRQGRNITDETTIASILCHFSVEILGDLKSQRADSLLKIVSHADSPNLRRRAIRAVISLGGDNLLEFAENVVADTGTYSNLDRFTLYEELGRRQLPEESALSEKDKAPIREFLNSAYSLEKNKTNRELLRDLLEK